MTREELRDRLAPIYRQLRQIVDDAGYSRMELAITSLPIRDSVIYHEQDLAHLVFLSDLFRDWKSTTEATR